ncbi:5-oxoprolinase subunit C family protein [Streptomyces endophyticus]|uniref:Biotin-dependent carboxyltransferase family protein n=1 Tax=Streptomyces endophyticus TaxID=714166 RepID=A0ABU6F888_9ACTN|nr:biotin-dependent carboxyltransferase family protein [Streptomyces endophyticus]MEB8340235.1 biotin-dependent carboxyltransferase family protein [Streptomyces endophyticus]
MTTLLSPPSSPTAAPCTGRPVAQLNIVRAGVATSIQDLGRTGLAHLGVPRAGPADRRSFTLANRLVGNAENTPALEVTLGGLELTLSVSRYVAVTGAPVPVTLDGARVADPVRVYVPAGSRLTLGRPWVGCRTYVAISGGIEADLVLGSAARDSLTGLGPEAVRSGSTLRLGSARTVPDVPLELAFSRVPCGGRVTARFRWGPRHDLFDAADLRRLADTSWRISAQADRVGARLTGPPLEIGSVDLPSEGTVRGAIQVPPSGEPIVFLSDHPVTGGYPVVGVVTDADTDLVAQSVPGDELRLLPIG